MGAAGLADTADAIESVARYTHGFCTRSTFPSEKAARNAFWVASCLGQDFTTIVVPSNEQNLDRLTAEVLQPPLVA
jgi:hypothetical protein